MEGRKPEQSSPAATLLRQEILENTTGLILCVEIWPPVSGESRSLVAAFAIDPVSKEPISEAGHALYDDRSVAALLELSRSGDRQDYAARITQLTAALLGSPA